MLDKEKFLGGINYLKACFLNFNFDIHNDMQIEIWYRKFSNLSDEVFMQVIKKYCDISKFPPNCPADLMELLKKEIKSNELNENEAWNITINLIHKYGFTYRREELYKELEKYPIIKKTVLEFERELSNLMVDDTYTPTQFKKYYLNLLDRKVEDKQQLLIGGESIIKLLIE